MRTALAPLLVCLLLIAGTGALYGVRTDRWGASDDLQQAVTGLDRVPMNLGDWVGKDVDYDVEMLARAQIKRGIFRRYTNSQTRESVSALIVCGRGGPISVHTPDVCYAGVGYEQLGRGQHKKLECSDRRTDEFWVGRFRKSNEIIPNQLEIYWAWSRDGVAWQAPENPRWTLARAPALYKLYVVRGFAPKSHQEAAPTIEDFLRQALPLIRQTLPSVGP